MAAISSSTSLRLEDARRRITRWRETRTHRGAPMPAALWAAAVALARQQGLSTTARTLPIDYGSLKKRLNATAAGRVPAPAFVELPLARPSGACVIELEARRGRRMRIEVNGVTWADLVALMQVAWGPR